MHLSRFWYENRTEKCQVLSSHRAVTEQSHDPKMSPTKRPVQYQWVKKIQKKVVPASREQYEQYGTIFGQFYKVENWPIFHQDPLFAARYSVSNGP